MPKSGGLTETQRERERDLHVLPVPHTVAAKNSAISFDNATGTGDSACVLFVIAMEKYSNRRAHPQM